MKRNILLVLVAAMLSRCTPATGEMDIFIKNGIVYDGIDSLPKLVSIGIKGDRIVYVGTQEKEDIPTRRTIDAQGLIVAPGFIDPHTHADRELGNPQESHNKPFLFQGVTTVVIGNDGSSLFPISKYGKIYEDQGIGTNVIFLVGEGTIRERVVGKVDRKATPDEVLSMQDLVQQEMDAGAFGMSTGLFYAPGSYAMTQEVISLAKVVAKNHGIYDTHLRDEGSYSIGLVAAVEEAVEIGKKANIPIHISHIKCLGREVWKRSDSIIKIVEEANKRGVEVTANQYPYEASATGLQAAVVPRWAESGGKDSLFIRYSDPNLKPRILEGTRQNIELRGGPEKLLIVNSEYEAYEGKTLGDLSESMELNPNEAVFEILKKGYARVASFSIDPYDIENFMQQEWVVTGSDGNTGHPRKYGAFPRKYKKHVKGGTIKLSDFINRSTSKTAQILRIPDRGAIQVGHYADIIIFNPETFGDRADYQNPFELSEGLEYSIINGKISVENGGYTEKLNGRILKKE